MKHGAAILIIVTLLLISCSRDYNELVAGCNIGNTSDFDSCVFSLAELHGAQICEYVGDDLDGPCFIHAAIGKDDEDICKRISVLKEKNTCFGSVALYNRRAKVIRLIEPPSERSDWYTSLALRTDDLEICRRITDDEDAHGRCIYDLARQLDDPDMCFYIDSNTMHKDACYYYMAVRFEDTSYCVPISGRIMKLKCETDAIVFPSIITGKFFWLPFVGKGI